MMIAGLIPYRPNKNNVAIVLLVEGVTFWGNQGLHPPNQ